MMLSGAVGPSVQTASPFDFGSTAFCPGDVACSDCGGQCHIRNGAEAQDATLQRAVAPDCRET